VEDVSQYTKEGGSSLGGAKAYLVCFSAALFFFYEFIQMHIFDAINDALRDAFSVNATSLGFLSSSYLWAVLLFSLPAGVLLDRYSARTIILSALCICILGTLGFAWSYSFWWAAFFHFLSGIGNAFCFVSCLLLVSRWFPPNRQAMVVGLVVTMAFLGGVVAQAPLAKLSVLLGWRGALTIDGFLGFFIFFQIYRFVEDTPSAKKFAGKAGGVSVRAELSEVLKNKQNHLAGLYTCLLNLPIMVICALWGTSYLQVVHAQNVMQATEIVSMILLGSIVGAPLAGVWSDSWEYRRRPMLIGAVLTLFTGIVLVWIPTLSFSSLVILFFFLGFFSSTQVISYPLIAESNASSLTGTATGLASLIIMGGAGVAQVIFGELLDWHWQGVLMHGQPLYTAADYQFAMWMFPVVFFMGLVCAFFTKEPLCFSHEKAEQGYDKDKIKA
jgi:MFS family permease